MSEEEGVFVGSGSFLIDRSRALDKLMRFQLPNPSAFALAWARCAAAGGASHFTVVADGGTLTATFDGRPLTKAELEDPYRCLFENRTAESDRNRQLAVGLLSVLRLKPDALRITSGNATKRVCLNVESLEKEEFTDAGEGEGTVVEVSWTDIGNANARLAADMVRAGCVLSALEVSVNGTALPAWTESAEERQYFQGDATRGWVAVPREATDDSELDLYWHGTLIEKVTMKLPLVQIRGAVNDDAFTLNASQSGVVRDARFDAALKRLAEPSRQLILATARSLAAAPVGPTLRDSYYRRKWRETLEEGRENDYNRPFDTVVNAAQVLWTMASTLDVPAKEAAVTGRAQAVRWMRRLCAKRLRPRSQASKDEVLNALWSAPLYLDAYGSALSLDDLAAQQKRLSYVPFCTDDATGVTLPFRPLWSLSAGEEELPGRLLDSATRDVSPTIARLKNNAGRPGAFANFEQAGLPVPLIRAPLALDAVAGEVGLSSQPDDRGRLHLLTQGVPSGMIELPPPLRYDAVLADPARRWERDPLTGNETELCRALSELAQAEALKLYRRLSEEHDPNSSSARAAAIRSHLLDYLAHAVRTPAEPDDWVRSVPLFEDRDGRWVDHNLAASALRTAPLYASKRGQEVAWQDGKNIILGPDLDAARLDSLFPGSARLPIRGRSGVFALVQGLTACDRAPAGSRCVASFRLGPQAIHAMLPASLEPGNFSWDKVTVHSAGGDGADLTGHLELVVELMLALVRQAGPLLGSPDDPLRLFFLKALAQAPAPWPGAAGKDLWRQLAGKPVFRSPNSPGRTLEDIYAALNTAGARLTYAANPSTEGAQPDVLLDANELEALRRFQPLGGENLQPLGRAARLRPVAVTEPEDPAPSTFLSVFRGKPAIRSNERFFLERRYNARSLDVWMGLSTRLPPPAAAFVPESAVVADLSVLPPLASILVDAGAGLNMDAAVAIPALMGFLRDFYDEIASRWPVAKPSSPGYVVSQRYLLEALRLAAAKPEFFIGWKPVLRKIRGLKAFTSLGGGWLSLDELADFTAEDGILLFADPAMPVPAITDGRPVPVLRNPKVVAEILSAKGPVKVKRFKPIAPPPEALAAAGRPVILTRPAAPPPDEEADEDQTAPAPRSEDLAARSPVLEAAFRLLSGLSGRKGLKLPRREISDLRLDRGFDGTLRIEEGSWTLNTDDALVKAVLNSELSAEEQGAYLASVAYTASNRLKNVVTDMDDIRFQEALADTL